MISDTILKLKFSALVVFITDERSGQSYLDSKLSPDTSLEDARTSLQRVWRDAGSHPTFADVVRKVWIHSDNATC